MVAVKDSARVTVRGGATARPPVRPADNWKAADRFVWQAAKTRAHANGSDKHEGVPGAIYEGALSKLVERSWPELDTDEMRKAKGRITVDLMQQGAAVCLDKGKRAGNNHNGQSGYAREPLWFIADVYGAIPYKSKGKAKSAPKVKSKPDPEIVVLLSRMQTKADRIRFALNYCADHSMPTDAGTVRAWLKDYGHDMLRSHVVQVRVKWLESRERRPAWVNDGETEPVTEPETPAEPATEPDTESETVAEPEPITEPDTEPVTEPLMHYVAHDHDVMAQTIVAQRMQIERLQSQLDTMRRMIKAAIL